MSNMLKPLMYINGTLAVAFALYGLIPHGNWLYLLALVSGSILLVIAPLLDE